VYRRLPEVLAAQGSTIEVLHTLRPLIVVMAGADEFDPYKDWMPDGSSAAEIFRDSPHEHLHRHDH
jgi:hypothetical protein